MWFDRDGISADEALNPLVVDGDTYNTGGRYEVVIHLQAIDPTTGTAFVTVNGLEQGFETDNDPETLDLSPAGMTFTGDLAKMQVFYGMFGQGATHDVTFEQITVTGCSGAINVGVKVNPLATESCLSIDETNTIPIAIMGDARLVVDQIDLATIQVEAPEVGLEGVGVIDSALVKDANFDSIPDLRIQVADSDGVLSAGSGTLTLKAKLLDGTPIEGNAQLCFTQ
jgi:hypothetical protein